MVPGTVNIFDHLSQWSMVLENDLNANQTFEHDQRLLTNECTDIWTLERQISSTYRRDCSAIQSKGYSDCCDPVLNRVNHMYIFFFQDA